MKNKRLIKILSAILSVVMVLSATPLTGFANIDLFTVKASAEDSEHTHIPGETVEENRVEANCTETGSYDSVAYCSVCGEELSREAVEIPALGHTEAAAVEENRVEPTMDAQGSYDSVVYCSVCGAEVSRKTVIIPAVGEGPGNYDELNGLVEKAEALDRTMYTDDSLEAVDAIIEKIDYDLKYSQQDIIDGWADELENALADLDPDTTKAEAAITTIISKKEVKKDEIVTVTVNLKTNFYITNIQIPVIFDKTQFEVVGTVTNKSYLTFADLFTGKNYTFGGRADRTNGFGLTSNDEYWDTDDAKAKYGYAYITAAYDGSVGKDDTTYVKPQDDVFVTFQLKALTDVADTTQSVFVSTDWAKTAENKGGLLTVGMTTVEDYNIGVSVIPYGNVDYNTATIVKEGVKVSGTVTSFDDKIDNSDDVTIKLYAEGSDEAAYVTTVTGSGAQTYELENVLAGTYTVTVEKANHATRKYTIVVEDYVITQDMKIHLVGDINGDGKVNTIDVARANANVKATALLVDYEKCCADVTDDGVIDIIDVSRIYAHRSSIKSLWDSSWSGDENEKVTVIITPDKTFVEPGGEITYTVSLRYTNNITSFQMNTVLPEGIEYIDESGVIDKNAKTALGFFDVAWTEYSSMVNGGTKGVNMISGYGADTSSYETDVVIGTFKGKVADDFTGDFTVTVDEVVFGDSDYCGISADNVTVIPAEVTVIEHVCSDERFDYLQKFDAIAPDCYTEGRVEYYECTCGKLYLDENATTETNSEDIVISATGHTDGEAVTENSFEEDCITDGSFDTVVYCTACGEELSRETTAIPALDHPAEYVSKTDRVEPTHVADGNIEYWTCSLCGNNFSDENCETQVSDVVIPALGHDDVSRNEWETDENSHFKTCSCGEILVTETHAFKWVTDEKATCTSTGLKHEECEVCGYVRNENTVIVVPHNTQVYAAVEPTCTSVGNIEYYICRDCGKCFSDSECTKEISVFSAMLPAKGHNYIAVVTPPTETEQGYTTYTCDGCGDSYKENFVDPSGKQTVSGTVTSFGSETDVITVELISKESDEILYSVTATGNLTEYTFEDVDEGEYIMSVSKNNHVTRTYEITVGESGISKDVKIHLKGDINGDGKVNTMDVARANANAKGVTPLADYEFSCADINGDKKVNTLDVARMNSHAKGVNKLW